jgi:formylglycine-generating enzyme
MALVSACQSEAPRRASACIVADRAVDPLARSGMVLIPGGTTVIGSDDFHPEERPKRRVALANFWIDRHEVTNAQFGQFVRATGYRTQAERSGGAGGGAVFREPLSVRNMADITQWWIFDETAWWQRPHGSSGNAADPDEPVVQITRDDALAYARWRGRDLPTEEEWERAARGGTDDAEFAWDKDEGPAAQKANHWQGVFPLRDTGTDGYKGVAPVGCFPPNGYGLFDMAGNVWELTSTRWQHGQGAPVDAVVIKGGSWLCADNFCLRYRPAAKQPADLTMGSDHIGFRTVWRPD